MPLAVLLGLAAGLIGPALGLAAGLLRPARSVVTGRWLALGVIVAENPARRGVAISANDYRGVAVLGVGEKLTETMAIENYIGELYGGPEFVGATLETRAKIQMVYSAITDIFNSTRDPLMKDGNYAQIFEDKFEQYGEIDFKLESLSKMLGTQDYIFGKPTLVDFKLAFTLELCAHLLKPIGMQHHLEKYKNLVDLKDRIRSLAGVKERIEASKGMWYVYQGVIKVDLILDA